MAFERVARYTIIDSENKNERTVPEERERARLCEPDERENSGREGPEKYLFKLLFLDWGEARQTPTRASLKGPSTNR